MERYGEIWGDRASSSGGGCTDDCTMKTRPRTPSASVEPHCTMYPSCCLVRSSA